MILFSSIPHRTNVQKVYYSILPSWKGLLIQITLINYPHTLTIELGDKKKLSIATVETETDEKLGGLGIIKTTTENITAHRGTPIYSNQYSMYS